MSDIAKRRLMTRDPRETLPHILDACEVSEDGRLMIGEIAYRVARNQEPHGDGQSQIVTWSLVTRVVTNDNEIRMVAGSPIDMIDQCVFDGMSRSTSAVVRHAVEKLPELAEIEPTRAVSRLKPDTAKFRRVWANSTGRFKRLAITWRCSC